MSDEPFTGDTSYNLPRGEEPAAQPGLPEIAGCALVQDLLPLYIDNEVSPESHVLIADHLQHCERCSGFLAGARSVRAQILDEETKVRAAFAYAPAVAAVQQPVWSSPLATLWRFVMLLVWLGSLALILVGVAEGHPEGMLIGGIGTLAAIGGLLIAGGEQRLEWRLGMLLTGLLGMFCVAGGLVDAFGYGMSGPIVVGGLMQLTIAAWGLWPRRPRATVAVSGAGRPGTPVGAPDSTQPMLSALLSLAGAALSAGLLLAGILMLGGARATTSSAPAIAEAQVFAVAGDEAMPPFEAAHVPPVMAGKIEAFPAQPMAPMAPAVPAQPMAPMAPVMAAQTFDVMVHSEPSWEPLVFGLVLIGAGLAGLLVIAGRRGWLPRELQGLTPRRWLGYGLVGAGLLWLSIALRALLEGMLPALPSAGIAAALVLLGWALARRPPPPEGPRVV